MTAVELRALLAKHPMPTPHMVHADLAVAAARALPALLDVFDAAKVLSARMCEADRLDTSFDVTAALGLLCAAIDRTETP